MPITHFLNQCIPRRMVFELNSIFVEFIREMCELSQNIFVIRIVRNFNQLSIRQIGIELLAHIITICEANSIKILDKCNRLWSSNSSFEQQICILERTFGL